MVAATRDAAQLIGRSDEIARLQSCWERAALGQQQVVVVTGEPGAGKTRVVFEFARAVATEATVLVGRCEREALVSYAPWVTVLQWIVRTTPLQVLRRHLAGVEAARELAHLVPEITTRIHVGKGTGSATPDGRRYLLFEATARLLAAAAQSAPLLLVIDDLHWADAGSLLYYGTSSARRVKPLSA